MENNKIIVTGASGFIGLNCLNLLLEKDYQVHAISRSNTHLIDHKNLTWHTINLNNLIEVKDLFKKIESKILMHLAWEMETGLILNSEDHHKWFELSKKIIDLFYENGGKKVLVSGSCAEYDWSNCHILAEDKTNMQPITEYGKAKNKLYNYLKSSERNFIWARIFFVYGPNQNKKSLVASIIGNLLDGKKVKTTGGEQCYDYLYVEDVALALILLIESKFNGAINVSSGKTIRLKTLINKIEILLQKEGLVVYGALPYPKNTPKILLGDNTLLKNTITWRTGYSLEKGLMKTIDFLKGNKNE